jgi:GH15 family glucan-1,4-alpha-glucosidase
MSAPLGTYALVGDCRTAALIGLDGSIDWLCWPRFDSDACFAALLGTPANGRWLIRPMDDSVWVSRRYRKDTLILETSFTTGTGMATLIDFMIPHRQGSHLVRLLKGVEGEVTLGMEFILRFGYGAAIPWVTRGKGGASRSTKEGSLFLLFAKRTAVVGPPPATERMSEVAGGRTTSKRLLPGASDGVTLME